MDPALKTINDRDRAFISQFCVAGEFFNKDGTQTALLCKTVNAGDILEFMHRWDAVLVAKMTEPQKQPKHYEKHAKVGLR